MQADFTFDRKLKMRKSEQVISKLFTATGERKYLTEAEREAFMAAALQHERGEVRTFGLVLAYTGCRISEALELTPRRIDLAARAITFRTLKQRRQNVYRGPFLYRPDYSMTLS